MLRDARFWLGAAVAFVVGLALGLGLYVWRVGTVTAAAERRAEKAEERLAELEASNSDLTAKLASVEASASEMEAELAKMSDDGQTADDESGSDGTEEGARGPAPRIVARSVDPEMVSPGGNLRLSVKVKGGAEKVRMRLVSRDKAIGFDKSYYLTKTSSGGTSTWTRTIKAPGDPGEYRFFASAWAGGKRVEMPGVSAWTFVVELQ